MISGHSCVTVDPRRRGDDGGLAAVPQAGETGPDDSGFTLLELLVVLAILGLLASIAAPQVLRHLGGAKTDAARIQIQTLSTTLDLYKLQTGRYPAEQDGLAALVERPAGEAAWNGPYLKRRDAIADPWGRPYLYRQPGQHGAFDLYSLGADARDGGEGENQDVANW
ncbi:MAG: type II secretion system major pseudopilin GspG [Magnetospirillum sp.]|nr:type II secretion system major pseudopilin GspG [Magnetospirillum sp.]